ncbi:Cap-specific mRNA (nucleoside-2'-O-)-methyltransferase 2 [Symbiodinium microadriaticum]|uniref:Cap-specific mRNA (Nucleoside-2'-O-)-methyltransferase 2 n=1 Tax=Symbiodinium microadriaticum TaxID=2951 RepID=A0A1Q9DQX6_SYMMI|nr:Cap-specific mRNA (nucleoside-2'-O-)-methyltransferase 2 [Symbiodinium microadriaticum]
MQLPTLQLGPPEDGWQEALLQRLRSGAGRGTPSRVDLAGAPNLSPAETWSVYIEVLQHCTAAWASGPERLRSLHLGREAPSSVLSLNQLLAATPELQPLLQRWRWRAVSENPHHELNADAAPEILSEVEERLYNHYQANWFHTESDSGRLIEGDSWNAKQYFWWFGLGRRDLAERLVHLAVASPAPGTQKHLPASLATVVAALGGLRVGGCLILHMPRRGLTLAGLVQHLFQRSELVAVPRGTAGQLEVFVVGWQFRGVQPALLQALSGAVSKELTAKQDTGLVDAVLGDPNLPGRLEAWQRLLLEGSSAAVRTPGKPPVQLHLLWGHCHESLLQSPPGASGTSTRQPDFQALIQRRRRLWMEVPAAKRARRTPSRFEGGRSWCQGWRQMMRSREADRVLLQTLEISAEAAVTAAKLWWKEIRLQPPWALVHSSLAEPEKLCAGISSRLASEERGGARVARLSDEAPPLLAAFVELLSSWLPKRLASEGGEALACQQCLVVTLPGGDETVSRWLQNAMGMSQARTLHVPSDGADAGLAGGQANLVLVELCQTPDAHHTCELATDAPDRRRESLLEPLVHPSFAMEF